VLTRTVHIEHQVVSLIRPEGDQYLVAASDELGQDRGLGSKTDIDRVSAWLGRW
jgi:hypothetical protein